MNYNKFSDIEDIENFNIRFRYFDGPDGGYQATFHIYDKLNAETHYQVNFQISGTEYNSDMTNSGKFTYDRINERYGNMEDCFKKIGTEYIKRKIAARSMENENVSLVRFI